MNHYEFAQLCKSTDKEAVIGEVFDESHDRWDELGRDELTEGEVTVLAVETFFGEILNGGFYQYFSNQSGGLTCVAPDALRRVGLHPYAPVLEEFIRVFPPSGPSEDDDERQIQLDAIADQYSEKHFDELERPFWELYRRQKSEFRDKLFAYVVANERQFVR